MADRDKEPGFANKAGITSQEPPVYEIQEGEDIEFPVVRHIMGKHLRQEGLRQAYKLNVAMRMHDRLQEMGYKPLLKPEDREQLADELLTLIFEG